MGVERGRPTSPTAMRVRLHELDPRLSRAITTRRWQPWRQVALRMGAWLTLLLAVFLGMGPHPAEPSGELLAWFGLLAPAATPKEAIARLNAEINAILAEPAIKDRLTELGGAPLIQTPEQFGKDIAAETEKWRKVVEGAGLKVE